MEILKCENVRKVYGSGNNQVVALDHIDLSVQKGEFVITFHTYWHSLQSLYLLFLIVP